MTYVDDPQRDEYTASSGQTVFAYTFRILADTDLVVYDQGTLKVLTTDYTVSGAGNAGGGNVTFGTGVTLNNLVIILRAVPNDQNTDYTVGGVFPAESHETALDKLTMQVQDLTEVAGRAPTIAVTSTLQDIEFPVQGSGIPIWNAGATALDTTTAKTIAQQGASITTDIYRFIADPAQADQGAATTDSIKTHIDAIGSADESILLPPGTYTYSTNESIPANVRLVIQPGAALSMDSGITVTIASPEQIIATDRQILFSGAATTPITFTNPGTISAMWFGAVADGSTSDQTALNELLLSAAADSTIFFPATTNYYKATALLDITKGLKIVGVGLASDIRQTTANNALFSVTGAIDGVEWRDLKMTGVQFATYSSAERAINVVGTSAAAPATNIKAKNCSFDTWAGEGIHLEYVTGFEVTHNRINDIHHAGILGVSAIRGPVDSNIINNIPGVVGSQAVADYGIVFSRNPSDSLVTEPRPKDIVISNNVVNDVTDWEGIDVHSGENIAIKGNTVNGCYAGIVATGTNNGSAVLTFASLKVAITGNTVDSGVTDGTFGIGIQHAGAEDGSAIVEYGTGSITGNTVTGYGLEDNVATGGISIQGTKGMAITGNALIDCAPNGIHVRRINNGFNVSGNSIIDPWSDTGEGIAVALQQTLNEGYIGGNSFRTATKSATKVLTEGIEIANAANNRVEIGVNDSEATTYIVDAGQKSLRGEITDRPTVTTGEDDLSSTTVEANTIGIGRYLKIVAAGDITDVAAGNKTVTLYFGATTIVVQAAANTNTDWKVEAIVAMAGASSQNITWTSYNGTTIAGQGHATASEDMTTDTVVKVTGTCADGTDTITQKVWLLERY